MLGKKVETTVYLQLEPLWSSYRGSDGQPTVRGVKVTKITQQRPKRINGVAVKLTVKLPAAAFLPLAPTVVVDVPEGALEFEPEVSVELPAGGEE